MKGWWLYLCNCLCTRTVTRPGKAAVTSMASTVYFKLLCREKGGGLPDDTTRAFKILTHIITLLSETSAVLP